MTYFNELDLLEQTQHEIESAADAMPFTTDVDRRKFVFASLAAAAATTFGFGAKALAQGVPGAVSQQGPQQQPPVPLDNMEALSWSFQPYPGGTGALLEKTYRETGAAAFKRQPFAWNQPTKGACPRAPWGAAAFPRSDEDIAFLPGYRLAAAIKPGKITSVRLTQVYLDRLKRLNPTLLCAVTIMEEQA